MAVSRKPRTQAEALDAIAAEMRIANQIEVLKLGTAALDDVDTGKTASPETARRQRRMNRIKAGIRMGLATEEQS